MENDKVVKTVPNIDVKDYLDDKGVEYKDAGRWIHLHCFWPDDHKRGDVDKSFSIDTEVLAYNCFGCGRSGTWTELCEALGWEVDIQPLVNQVNRALWGDIQRGLESMMSVEGVDHIAFHPPRGTVPIQTITGALKYMRDRGFSEATLEAFDI